MGTGTMDRRGPKAAPKATRKATKAPTYGWQSREDVPGGVLYEEDRLIFQRDLPFDEWDVVLGAACRAHKGSPWWIGDALEYGEARFGEQYAQAVDATTLAIETLQQYARVARQVSPSRRVKNLSWSHHREVADLEPDDQERWLARALAGDDGVPWSSDRLRRELNQASRTGEVELWVVVACENERDREALTARLVAEGRKVKAVERHK